MRIEQMDRLDCRLRPHRWDFDLDPKGEIDAFWREQTQSNPALYDGIILLANRIETRIDAESSETVLEVDFFEARFSRLLAWRDFGYPDQSVFNCFAMPALRCSDGAFLLGEMAPGHSSAGQLFFPAGTPDRLDLRGDRVDLLGSVIRELAEETGLRVDALTLSPSWRVVFLGQQVACMKIIDWPAPAQAVALAVERYIASETAPELLRAHMFSSRAQLEDPRLPGFMKAFLAQATPP